MSSDIKDGVHIEEKKVMKEKSKIGHRRINDEGTVTYKKKTTSEIQKALQLGIRISVTLAHNKSKRDMLLKDFGVVETLSFPRAGGKDTPTHDLSDFTFKTFAPIAFRYFRDFFQVDITDYLNSICHQELRELSNAGASGSIFYITCDDEFIIKTVQHKEASFLQKLLPEYYINLIQHPRTLLPKFYGLYCYQTMGKNIRFVIMNNLVPSIMIHEKYDLKGSTYKRYADEIEKNKTCPTLKDLDFKVNHSENLYLEVDTYEALLNTIQRDCRVLESFSIMDYSLLLGIHNLDQSLRTRKSKEDEIVDNKNHFVSDNHAMKDFSTSDDVNNDPHSVQLEISQSINQKDNSFIEDRKNLTKESEPIVLNNKNSSENSDYSSAEYYCTPGIGESPEVNHKAIKNFDSEPSRSKFNILPITVLNGFYKPVSETEKSSADGSSLKSDGFFTKLYPYGKQLQSYVVGSSTNIIKIIEKCVEHVIHSAWLECEKDLYSVFPPVAILSSGSSDSATIMDSDEMSSLDTEMVFPTGFTKSEDLNSQTDSIRGQNNQSNSIETNTSPQPTTSATQQNAVKARETFNRQKSRSKSTRRIAAYSTVLESIQAPVEQVELQTSDEEYIPTGGIPARNKFGDRLILFMGIIDILQSYRFMKKMEHNMKAIFLDPSTISVTNPTFYAQRFQDFFANEVFKKIPSLDQPQILGTHARRFRNFVHMAMRQNPERKRSSIRKEYNICEKDRSNQTWEISNESKLVIMEHENKVKHEKSESSAVESNKGDKTVALYSHNMEPGKSSL